MLDAVVLLLVALPGRTLVCFCCDADVTASHVVAVLLLFVSPVLESLLELPAQPSWAL
jgi:hypothetical protein